MAKFRYTARDKDSKLVNGIVESTEQDDAVVSLQAKGLIVVSISIVEHKAVVRQGIKKLRRKLKPEDLAFFCRQMATLLNAGVTLLRSLSILLRETSSRPLYNAIDKIRTDVEEGHNLHDAMAHHPKVFQGLWVSMVEAGEASGQLPSTFDHLASYMERSGAVIRKVKAAMIYPIILLAVCTAAILIFTLKIIPMFGDIYKGFNMELPLLTLGVMKFSSFMQRYIIFIILFAGVIFYGLRAFITKTLKGRIMFDNFKLRIPLLGVLVQGSIIERFANGLGILIKSGIPILTGLDLIGKSCGNKIYEDAIIIIKEDVRAGKSLSGLLEASGLFPTIVTQMVNVGEETGRLSDMLERVSIYYQEEIDSLVERLTAAFEPLLLIFMGITVGTLVVAMYLPIFKIATGGAGAQ